MQTGLLAAGFVTLALVWLGPLPALAPSRFSAHMAMHIGVVAVAAPLVALGMAGTRLDPVRVRPALFSAVPAAILELVVVWAWHAPALHHAARGSTSGLAAEQTMFLASALLVWISAFGGDRGVPGDRTAAGILALLLTSMHMTLLGSLIALAPRPLYAHAAGLSGGRMPLDEQHLGGVIMLLVGGAAYLAGGLYLTARLVNDRRISRVERAA